MIDGARREKKHHIRTMHGAFCVYTYTHIACVSDKDKRDVELSQMESGMSNNNKIVIFSDILLK